MRVPFLFLTALLLPTPRVAFADDVDARRESIVRGEPVGPGGVLGTVAIAFTDPGFEPEAVPLDLWPSCTGVLIAPSVVLTAAHCLEVCYQSCEGPDAETVECFWCEEDLRAPSELRVLARLRTLEDRFRADQVEVIRVREHFVPEDYVLSDAWDSTTRIPDIAVLQLVAVIRTLNPVPLTSSADDLEGRSGTAIGYGLRTPPGSDQLLEQDYYETLLHQADVRIDQTADSELLTETLEEGGGVCFGDSGGPLYVNRGGTVEVAGIASRVSDVGCRDGTAVYVSTAAYQSWIYEKAPEASRFSLTGGGGGCSVQSTAAGEPTLWLAGLLGILLIARSRTRARVYAVTAPLLVMTAACGSGGDSSFCTEQYDPTGLFCSPDYALLDLQTAETLARADLPDGALLLQVRSSAEGLMDPDGSADSWWFLYYLPGRAEPPAGMMIQTLATSTSTYPYPPERVERLLRCIPSEPVPVLNSRRLIHDAIRFLESDGQTVSLGDGGNLWVLMSHVCVAWASPPLLYVRYRGNAVAFDDQGSFFAITDLDP